VHRLLTCLNSDICQSAPTALQLQSKSPRLFHLILDAEEEVQYGLGDLFSAGIFHWTAIRHTENQGGDFWGGPKNSVCEAHMFVRRLFRLHDYPPWASVGLDV
jgi:hypothetical protein